MGGMGWGGTGWDAIGLYEMGVRGEVGEEMSETLNRLLELLWPFRILRCSAVVRHLLHTVGVKCLMSE